MNFYVLMNKITIIIPKYIFTNNIVVKYSNYNAPYLCGPVLKDHTKEPKLL